MSKRQRGQEGDPRTTNPGSMTVRTGRREWVYKAEQKTTSKGQASGWELYTDRQNGGKGRRRRVWSGLWGRC